MRRLAMLTLSLLAPGAVLVALVTFSSAEARAASDRCGSLTGTPADMAQVQTDLLTAINSERRKRDLVVLLADERLNRAAQTHAEDIARRGALAHRGTDGSEVDDRALREGYDYIFIAENVAAGQTLAFEAVEGWMRSPGHRRNILNKDARHLGAGFAIGPDILPGTKSRLRGCYWVMVAGREKDL